MRMTWPHLGFGESTLVHQRKMLFWRDQEAERPGQHIQGKTRGAWTDAENREQSRYKFKKYLEVGINQFGSLNMRNEEGEEAKMTASL